MCAGAGRNTFLSERAIKYYPRKHFDDCTGARRSISPADRPMELSLLNVISAK